MMVGFDSFVEDRWELVGLVMGMDHLMKGASSGLIGRLMRITEKGILAG